MEGVLQGVFLEEESSARLPALEKSHFLIRFGTAAPVPEGIAVACGGFLRRMACTRFRHCCDCSALFAAVQEKPPGGEAR